MHFLLILKASHLIGGFKKSVGSAYRMCRTCMATSDTFRRKFNSNHFQRRSTATHIQHCDSLQGVLKEHNSKVYGVNTRSILLDVKLFSMCNLGMPHDIMHDLFEGVVQYELKLLILHCIDEGYISLSEFNKRLLSFEFGYSELADKPVPLTTQHVHSKDGKHLRQGSAQTWLLARIIPFIVASDIPESDVNWKCFLKRLRVIDIALAPVVNADVCAVLKILTEEHHELFSTLYPNWTVTPKMPHYPGPIRQVRRPPDQSLIPMTVTQYSMHERERCVGGTIILHARRVWRSRLYITQSGRGYLPADRSSPGHMAESSHFAVEQFRPTKAFKFPKRQGRGEEFEWCDAFSWLHYDVDKDAAFCYLCMPEKKFLVSTKREPAFVLKGFTYWKEGPKAFKKHQGSDCHREAVDALVVLPQSTKDVGDLLSSEHQAEKARNRKMLLLILENIRFLARQGLPLRGDSDECDSNFIQLLRLRGGDRQGIDAW